MIKSSKHENPAVALVERLTAIGTALSAERDPDRLLEMILLEAKTIAGADGGTLYLRMEDESLVFSIIRTDSLGITYGGSSGKPPPMRPIALYKVDGGKPDYNSQAVFAVLRNKPVNIADAYEAEGFDFEGTKRFDTAYRYRTKSVLTIPMTNHKGEVIGCLQLVNAQNEETGEIIPFSRDVQHIVQSLASQAGVILDNRQLIEAQKNLLEAFIKLIAKAIDAKSPYTGAHCERVPRLTSMLAEAACGDQQGLFKEFNLTEEEKYELHIAGWLHDCGKVTTPVHVMDKATKLETIFDRIELIRTRFEVMKREARIRCLEAQSLPGADKAALETAYQAALARMEEDLAFLATSNIGGEFMADEKIARLKGIAAQTWQRGQESVPVLTEEEIYNLSIRRGTITNEEREIMNNHMVVTLEMLEALPFPKHLRRVPEYAGGHHEKMDGTGYPRRIKAGEMSIPARMMAVADVFEALTASDRPYKPAKKLSEAMGIIGMMKKTNHLDPGIVDFFVTSGTYRRYAEMYLAPELIDTVDEAAILGIVPEGMRK